MITNYNDLPIGGCVRLNKANDIEDEATRVAEILSILTGLDRDGVMAMPISDFMALQRQATWVWDEPQAASIKKRYIFGGWTADVTQSVAQMTAAQFIDFQNLAKSDCDIVDVLAVALVPEGKTYGNGYDYEAFKQAIADYLPTPDAIAIIPFFVGSLMTSCGVVLRSSAEALRRAARRTKGARRKTMMRQAAAMEQAARSLSAGGGFRRWRLWLKSVGKAGRRCKTSL